MITLIGAVFLGFAVEALAGFGATVITLAVASQAMSVDSILAAFLPVNLMLSTYLVIRYRRDIDAAYLVRRVLPWMLPGVALGRWWANAGGPDLVRTTFAYFVTSLAAVELYSQFRAKPNRPLSAGPAAAAIAGSGVVHGMFACGGPLLVYAMSREITEKSSLRATLSAVWLTMNTLVVVTLAVAGEIGTASLTTSGLLLLPLFAGATVGEWAHRRLTLHRFRTVVFGLLFVAGALLLLR